MADADAQETTEGPAGEGAPSHICPRGNRRIHQTPRAADLTLVSSSLSA